MPIIYKINVLDCLRDLGYTSYKLRKDKILAESTIQKLRKNEPISWENIETLCNLLSCKLEDLLEYVPEDKTE